MALQKVDAIIAGVGAFALLATVLGVVFYEELAGEQDITFPTTEMTLGAQQGLDAPLTFTMPDNATAATLAVDVSFTGQSGAGGTATVQIDFTDPMGNVDQVTGTLTIGANTQSATTTINVPMFSWADVPEARTAEPGSIDETQSWDNPLTVTVSVTAPSDTLGALPNVAYNFSATVTPTVTVYSAVAATPDVETA